MYTMAVLMVSWELGTGLRKSAETPRQAQGSHWNRPHMHQQQQDPLIPRAGLSYIPAQLSPLLKQPLLHPKMGSELPIPKPSLPNTPGEHSLLPKWGLLDPKQAQLSLLPGRSFLTPWHSSPCFLNPFEISLALIWARLPQALVG